MLLLWTVYLLATIVLTEGATIFKIPDPAGIYLARADYLYYMENAFFIINKYDIPAAVSISRKMPGCRSYVFNPTLLDIAIGSGLSDCEFVNWDDCFEFPDLVKWSHSTASEIERKLDASVREIIPEISIFSWQHLNLYHILMAARWYSRLWAEIAPRFVQHKIHVCFDDNPAHNYWSSFIPALLLLQNLRKLNIEFSVYNLGGRPDDTDAVPDLRQYIAGTFDILTHITTCYYDIDYINDELIASGKTIIDLQSKYPQWNVSVAAQHTVGLSTVNDLLPYLSDDVRQKAEALFSQLTEGLNEALSSHIVQPEYRVRQSTHTANLYKSQLIVYYALNAYFKEAQLTKLLLSDNDAGFHGPMIAFAKKHRLPILLLPHAKTSANLNTDYRDIISLHHPIQGEDILDANSKAVFNFSLRYPENFTASTTPLRPIRKIALVLNGLSINGIYCTRYSVYMEGIKKIMQWCKQHDIELYVRSRPGQTISKLLSKDVGLDQNRLQDAIACSLGDFAQQDIDLCLMYDMPTSGVIEFLTRSIPVLNPVPEPLAPIEAAMGNSNIAPRDTIEGILALLDMFIADVVRFQDFKIKQFIAYMDLFKNAHALRSFL